MGNAGPGQGSGSLMVSSYVGHKGQPGRKTPAVAPERQLEVSKSMLSHSM